MRKMMLFFVLSLIFWGCNAPKELTSEGREKVFNTQKITGSKTEIKNKLLLFVNESFGEAKAVLQTNEDGLLTGVFNTRLKPFDPLETIMVHADMSFLIKYNDGEYKLKMVLKRIYTRGSSGENTMQETYWGNYEPEVIKKYDEFFDRLKKYLLSDNSF